MTAPAFTLDPVQPPRLSMSFLRAAGDCLRRAHFERIESGSGQDALIGRIVHEVTATTGFAVTMRGDTRPREGEVTEIARRVMACPEGEIEPLSRDTWTQVLEVCAGWERWARFHPGDRFEISMRHEKRGRTLSARIDVLRVDGTTAWVKDYKSGHGEPLGRAAPTPQGDNYAWHIWREYPWIDSVWFTQDHMRFGAGEPFEYTLDAIFEIDAYLDDAVSRIDTAYGHGGELPTNPGDACSKWGGCPVARDCPVKKWARPAGDVLNEADAVAQFEAMLTEEAAVADRKKRIQAWLKEDGRRALALNGQEIGWAPEPGTATDWKGLAQSLGGNPGDFTSTKAPAFGRRKAK